ncbi:MAG: hypothetical protein KGH66_00465 [Candidatus Micrarchaeota archaeon]|nr:hypothetical protein [Candidatus Micrarchaeota archaeon]
MSVFQKKEEEEPSWKEAQKASEKVSVAARHYIRSKIIVALSDTAQGKKELTFKEIAQHVLPVGKEYEDTYIKATHNLLYTDFVNRGLVGRREAPTNKDGTKHMFYYFLENDRIRQLNLRRFKDNDQLVKFHSSLLRQHSEDSFRDFVDSVN